NGFLVQPFNVPTGIPGVMVPASPAVAPQNGWAGIMVDGHSAAGKLDIERNYVHDSSCADGIDVRAMGSSRLSATVNRNTVANLKNSSFRDNVGDMFEEGNLGAGSTMRFVADHVVADGTSVRGGNPPGSSDGGSNPIPFNIGDCMVAGHNGGADSTTFVMRNSVFKHCNNGISFGSNVGQGNGSGPAKQLIADISHSVITHNAKYGLHVGNFTPMDL